MSHDNFEQHENSSFALYGLGTETERFLNQNPSLPVVGLLDGYRESGELYGHPILSLQEAFERGARTIVVIARPGSCKAIAKRISTFCTENGVALMDVRGQDLLAPKTAAYDLVGIRGYTKAELREKIEHADVVSFDLFDTLVMRKALSYTDIFELLALRLAERGIIIPNFAAIRLAAEKELSRDRAPTLEEIYERMLADVKSHAAPAELAELEWELDCSTMLPRREMCAILREAAASGSLLRRTAIIGARRLNRFSRLSVSQKRRTYWCPANTACPKRRDCLMNC